MNGMRGLILATANRYQERNGRDAIFPDRHGARIDRAFARDVAKAFQAAPDSPHDPDVREAYRALASETMAQWDILTGIGVRFTPFGDDINPYPAGSSDVFADLDTGHLFVYNGGETHSLLTRFVNYAFRAVHDVFGHYLNQCQFGPRGEETAYQCHRRMFSPTAVKALTSETRGQNSWVNFGPFAHLPAAQRPFAQQKSVILPAFCFA